MKKNYKPLLEKLCKVQNELEATIKLAEIDSQTGYQMAQTISDKTDTLLDEAIDIVKQLQNLKSLST